MITVLKENRYRSFFRLSISNHAVFIFILFLILPSVTAQTGAVQPPPDSFEGEPAPKFNSSMAITMVVLISVFFLLGFFSVYIRQCAERRIRGNSDPYAIFFGGAANHHRSRRTARGLDISVINSFPTFMYSAVKGHKIGKDLLECAVCLNEFEDDETLRLIPKCNHVFHPDCIDAWLACQHTCPVCRANLVPEPGEIIPPVHIQILGPDSGESDNINEEISQSEPRRDVESSPPVVNHSPNPNRTSGSRSNGWKLSNLFPRSRSTGLVQPGQNCERFTLRLPEEVRNQLMNSTLNRSKSCVEFPRVRSSKSGFRSGSGGIGRTRRSYSYYERFDRPTQPDRWWGFSRTPPFLSRTGSKVVGGSGGGGGDEATPTCTPPKLLFKSVKSPLRLLSGSSDADGERSFDRLRPDHSHV